MRTYYLSLFFEWLIVVNIIGFIRKNEKILAREVGYMRVLSREFKGVYDAARYNLKKMILAMPPKSVRKTQKFVAYSSFPLTAILYTQLLSILVSKYMHYRNRSFCGPYPKESS